MKSPYALVIILSIVLIGCDPCDNVTCLNEGVCDDGTCNCIYPYEGDDCSEISRPGSIEILQVRVKSFNPRNVEGFLWDQFEVNSGPGWLPDIVLLAGSSFSDQVIGNADPDETHVFTFETCPAFFSIGDLDYYKEDQKIPDLVRLMDRDSGSSLLDPNSSFDSMCPRFVRVKEDGDPIGNFFLENDRVEQSASNSFESTYEVADDCWTYEVTYKYHFAIILSEDC